jgi:putative ATPase
MSRERTGSLFDDEDEPAAPARIAPDAPLAERMRPRTLDEFVGQSNLVGEKSLLGSALRGGATFSSLILWGPPGSGKTTLARLIAARKGADFIGLSAILAGVKDVRAAIEEARCCPAARLPHTAPPLPPPLRRSPPQPRGGAVPGSVHIR